MGCSGKTGVVEVVPMFDNVPDLIDTVPDLYTKPEGDLKNRAGPPIYGPPIYGPLISGHPSYPAMFNRHRPFSLYVYPSTTATPLMRPAATFSGPQVTNLSLKVTQHAA